ncbi:MAG TPA: class I SAM-dependent methyltransferase [Terriglobales bacterium]|nr:class I SAM-dependent methyltransferase [Terriglobales bacterium]
MNCRNCGSLRLKDLGFIGEVAPFFLKRVLNMEIRTAQARHPLRRLARLICALPQRFFAKVYGSSAYVEMQICLDCSFVATKHPFCDEAIGRLYSDYRSAAYNQERVRYEPSYASVADHIGSCEKETRSRVGGLTAWLAGKIKCESDFSMLDYGGSDGRFLPTIQGRKYVYEISDIPSLREIVKVTAEADLTTYSFVQVAHLLEHVPHPLSLLKHISTFMSPSGYLYIEVPQELTDVELADLKNGTKAHGLAVHEHINAYSIQAVRCLVQAARLSLMAIEPVHVDLGWTTGTNIRALCQRSGHAQHVAGKVDSERRNGLVAVGPER